MNRAKQHANYKWNWETPQWLFDYCNRTWGPFNVDMAASAENKKVVEYFDLSNPCPDVAPTFAKSAWLNPPYGRAIGDWLRKAHNWACDGVQVCALLPTNTSAKWWHLWAEASTVAMIYLIKGRVNYVGSTSSNTGGSCLFIFSKEIHTPPRNTPIYLLNLDAYRPKRGQK